MLTKSEREGSNPSHPIFYLKRELGMIYTGYFAKTSKYIKAKLLPVSVAGKTPIFFKGPKWLMFAPRKDFFWEWKRGDISNEEYMEKYVDYLNQNISEETLNNIKLLSERKDIVMCCYEKSSDFCHRHTLAEWLSNKINIPIGEVEILN